jgi:hypothetical protein
MSCGGGGVAWAKSIYSLNRAGAALLILIDVFGVMSELSGLPALFM